MRATSDVDQMIRLLLVDDEADFREATSKVLSRRGFEVTGAGSGEEALELLEAAAPDLVLLDLRMEGIDGIETLRRLRARSAELPVIILTGHGQVEDAMAGLELGIVDFMHKPVGFAQLATRIRSLLRRGQTHPLQEKRIAELMVPLSVYRRVFLDDPIAAALEALRDSLASTVEGALTEQGHRSVLVYDREERFVGLVHVREVLASIVPAFLRDSPYTTYFTGMFLSRTAMLGKATVSDLVDTAPPVDVEAPLMEAVHLLLQRSTVNLPVARGGEVVGILRDKDLLLEVAAVLCRD